MRLTLNGLGKMAVTVRTRMGPKKRGIHDFSWKASFYRNGESQYMLVKEHFFIQNNMN